MQKLSKYAYILILILTLPSLSPQVFASHLFRDTTTAQDLITGQVIDRNKLPLEGATVQFSPGGPITTTDSRGHFSIRLPADTKSVDILRISNQGKESLSIPLSELRKHSIFTLFDAENILSEVVVTGYGDVSKRRSTGSVNIVLPEDLDHGVRNIDEMLQGKVPGLVATALSGRPGERYRVVIRGNNTINGNTEPLWVVDGVPLQQNIPSISNKQVNSENMNEILSSGIGHIDPNDIEQITVLKDASAAAIYGSRAAGGVIVITTKRGQSGRTKINYGSNLNIGLKPQRDAGLMSSKEKLDWERVLWDEFSDSRFANSSLHVPVIGLYGMLKADKIGQDGKLHMDTDFVPYSQSEKTNMLERLSSQSTDWFDVLFRNSFSQNHHLSFDGGNPNNNYYVSLGYTDQGGLVKHTGYDRYNLSAKINTKIGERINLGWNLNLSRQQSDSYSMGTNPFEYAYFANPYERPYDQGGNYINDVTYHLLRKVNDGKSNVIDDQPPFGYNILNEMENTHSDTHANNAVLITNLDFKISKSLKFSGMSSYSYSGQTNENRIGKNTYAAFEDRLFFDQLLKDRAWVPYGSITQSNATSNSYNVRGQFVYDSHLGRDHNLRVSAGAEIRGNNVKRFFTKRYGYNEETFGSTIPVNPNPTKDDHKEYTDLINSLSGQFMKDDRFASFYGLANYVFRGRYVVNGSVRTDGSNNFGGDQQFNPTWSLGLAWHMDEEPFFRTLRPIVNRLSIRTATGFTGNVVDGNKKHLVISLDNAEWNGLQTGRVSTAPNPNLRWEKTYDRKLSVDFSLFESLIDASVESYFRRSSDIITQSMINATTGFMSQSHNTSTIENRGLEASMKFVLVRNSNLNISLGANVAWNENKLTKYLNLYGDKNNLDVDRTDIAKNSGLFVGYPTNGIFGGKYIGIDPYSGIYSFRLRDDAYIVNQADLNKPQNYIHYLGTPDADITGGVNLRTSYRNFNLNIGGSFFKGRSILNTMKSPAGYSSAAFGNSTMFEKPQSMYSDLYRNHLNVRRDATDRWTSDNPTDVKYPRIVDYAGDRLNLEAYSPYQEAIVNSAFREDVSFFRLRDITLGFNVPQKYLHSLCFQRLSISGTLNNFFTFTNYKGIDAETPGATYPITKSVFFRIQAGF